MTSQDVINAVTADLRKLDSRAFEWLLGDFFERHGWKTKVTAQSWDGGVDVIASHVNLPQCPPWKVYVQARQYTENNVQANTLENCIGKIRRHRDMPDRVLLISTGQTTYQAEITEANRDITVWEGEDLARYIVASDSQDLIANYI